jgi:hypothetical protein
MAKPTLMSPFYWNSDETNTDELLKNKMINRVKFKDMTEDQIEKLFEKD